MGDDDYYYLLSFLDIDIDYLIAEADAFRQRTKLPQYIITYSSCTGRSLYFFEGHGRLARQKGASLAYQLPEFIIDDYHIIIFH